MTQKPSRLPKDAWIHFTFLALVVAFFFDSLFLGKIPLMRETFADFIPRLEFAGSAYRGFKIPLWNTQTGCGQPFFADPSMGAAYPLNAVFYILPPAWAYRLTLVFHFVLAGCGMIALARLWGLRPCAALFAAVGFVFGTHTVAMAEFFNAIFPISWGPLIIYLASLLYDRFHSRPKEQDWLHAIVSNWSLVAALSICLALCYFAGNPQYLAFTLVLAGGCLVARFIHDRKPAPFVAAAVTIGFAGITALLLVAPQLLPFLELLGHSFRSAAIAPGYDHGSVHSSLLLTFLFPFLFGAPGGLEAYWGDSISEYQLGAFYVGLLPLIAAFFVIRAFQESAVENARWLRVLAIMLILSAAGAMLMAAGKHLPVYALMRDIIPGLDRLRWPSRFMLLATWAIPLLGALGFHLLLARKAKGETAFHLEWAVLFLFLALAALLVKSGDVMETFIRLVGPAVETTPARLLLFKRDLVTALVVIGAAVAGFTLLLKANKDNHFRVLEFVIVVIAFLNVAIVGRRVYPASEENVFAYEPKTWSTFQNLAAGDPHWRIDSAYAFDQSLLYGVSDPTLFKLAKKVSAGETWLTSGIPCVSPSDLGLSRYSDFYTSITTASPAVAGKLRDLLNVQFVVSGPPWSELAAEGLDAELTVDHRDHPLPRAFLANRWRDADRFGFADGLRTLASPEFDIHSEILLETGPARASLSLQSDPADPVQGDVSGLRYDWNRVEMQANASRPCLLVLNDTWYPNWKATVNGEPAPVFRANLLFRAVEIPAGESSVVFEYIDPQFRLGLILATLGVVLLGSGFVVRRRMIR